MRDAIGALGDARQQRLLDGPAGRVLGVDDAARGVAALAAQLEMSVAIAIEGDAQLVGEAQDVLGRLAHAALDDVAVAKAVADAQRVLDVDLGGVGRVQHAGDATLRGAGVRIGGRALGDDQDTPVVGRRQREGQAPPARTR